MRKYEEITLQMPKMATKISVFTFQWKTSFQFLRKSGSKHRILREVVSWGS